MGGGGGEILCKLTLNLNNFFNIIVSKCNETSGRNQKVISEELDVVGWCSLTFN